MKLPDMFTNLFRNYVFDQIDDEKHAQMIIKTVLAYGEWEQIMWLFQRYGRGKVGEVFLKDYYGLRNLPASTRSLWELVFVPNPFMPPGGKDPVERWHGHRVVPSDKLGQDPSPTQ